MKPEVVFFQLHQLYSVDYDAILQWFLILSSSVIRLVLYRRCATNCVLLLLLLLLLSVNIIAIRRVTFYDLLILVQITI